METIHLQREGLRVLRRMNPLLVSYNVEMAEVTGGTFWKEYTKAQIRGEEPYQAGEDAGSAMQVYEPVNLYYGLSERGAILYQIIQDPKELAAAAVQPRRRINFQPARPCDPDRNLPVSSTL